MPKTLANGDVQYEFPDTYTDVTFNGSSVLSYEPIEILVRPDGWGRVLLKKALIADSFNNAGEGKKLVDGQTRTFTYWGWVTVT